MPITMHGLDLDFMKRNPLPPREEKPRDRLPSKRSEFPSPYFCPDISAFVSPVGETPEVISSRPQLREHEKKHNCYQTGNDFKPGEIGAKNEAARLAREELGKGVEIGWGEL